MAQRWIEEEGALNPSHLGKMPGGLVVCSEVMYVFSSLVGLGESPEVLESRSPGIQESSSSAAAAAQNVIG